MYNKLKRYNGYTNYPTWVVSLWINNDKGTQDHWDERARQIYRDVEIQNEPLSYENQARIELSKQLEHEFCHMVGSNPLANENSVYADLLRFALDYVNWNEIAGDFIEEIPKEVKKELKGEV